MTKQTWVLLAFTVLVAAAAVGSSDDHPHAVNETLFWERLPTTIAFMGLVSAQVVDRVSVRAGLAPLAPAKASR